MSVGVNLPAKNLFSQISSNLAEKKLPETSPPNLSEINPVGSLGSVTAPLDAIWQALGTKFNINAIKDSGALKSSLAGRLSSKDTSTLGQGFGIAKSALTLIANILVAVLEIALWILKGIINLV